TGLTNDDRTGTYDENGLDVCTLGHEEGSVCIASTAAAERRRLAAENRAEVRQRPGFRLPVTYGIRAHEFDEVIEQHQHVVRPRTGFRMTLEAERRPVGELKALQRTVKQRLVRNPRVGRQGVRVDF